MNVDSRIESILDAALSQGEIGKEEAVGLLTINLNSDEWYALTAAADSLSRRQFSNRGEVYAQIGVNFWPCPMSCGFCSFGEEAGLVESPLELDVQELVTRAREFETAGANAIFLMATADYPFDRFIELGRAVRKAIAAGLPLVANIGDFDSDQAEALISAGFQGVYHVSRLREGRDTKIPLATRLTTLETIRNSALDLGYCVEPIGPEHSPEELAAEMFRGREYGAANHACMRRTPLRGTALSGLGEIPEIEMAKAVAVTRLAIGKFVRAVGVHEPSLLSLRSGANQIYAETGPNPRDTKEDTSRGRGRTVEECKRMLWEAGWIPLEGPTKVFRGA